MHSATSYFKTLVRSDLRHYWPVCFGYTFIWILMLPVVLLRNLPGEDEPLTAAAKMLSGKMMPTVVMAVFFGVIAAMACYSYLMNSRSVGLLHSLPAKRSTQFFAHFTAGMGMLLGGNVIVFVLTVLAQLSAIGAVAWSDTLLWLLTATLLDFIFFAMAVFCAMFTGWLLAVPVLYVGLNFAAAVIHLLLNGLSQVFYFGYCDAGMQSLAKWLTPIVNLGEKTGRNPLFYSAVTATGNQKEEFLKAVCIYTAVALVLLGVSYLLYRTRRSESAADSVAFSWAKPIFRYVIAILGGLSLGLGLYWLVFNGDGSHVELGVCLLVMTVICYFAAEMLIRRSLRVFRKSWKGLVAACAVIALLCIGMGFDVFGFERYVPDAAQVKNVTVNISGKDYAEAPNCTDEETVMMALAAHESAVAQGRPADGQEENVNLYLKYTMADGHQVCRRYKLAVKPDTDLYTALNMLGNAGSVQRYTLMRDGKDWTPEMIRGGYINGEQGYCQMTKEQARALYDALHCDMVANSNSWDVLKEDDYLYYGIEFEGGTDQAFYVDRIPESFKETQQVIDTLDFENDDDMTLYVD